VPPRLRDLLKDPGTPLWITEGVIKTDSMVSAGFACISISGVYGWRTKNDLGGLIAHPTLNDIAWNGRTVTIGFDSDVATNTDVQHAESALGQYLKDRKAHVQVTRIPSGDDGAKQGVDDFLTKLGFGEDPTAAFEPFIQDLPMQDEKPNQATRLVALAKDAELFHDRDKNAYATIEVNRHRETWLLRTRTFKRWLGRQFYESENTSPGSQAIADALTVLEGRGVLDGPEHPVFTRLGHAGDATYLDLANDRWEAIRIDVRGWEVVDKPAVRFRRAKGMLPCHSPSTAA
jgi:hypothetical protein